LLRRLPVDRCASGGVEGEHAAAAPQTALSSSEHTAVANAGNASRLKILAENAAQAPGMALLLRPSGVVDFWDEHWEELTGLTPQELAGVSGELFLDWLLPRQSDRDFVADLFHQPRRGGSQALLEIAGRKGNRQLLCRFLPVRTAALRQEPRVSRAGAPTAVADVRFSGTDAWLLCASNPT
jgi:PAS domain-containing protein